MGKEGQWEAIKRAVNDSGTVQRMSGLLDPARTLLGLEEKG